MQYMLFGIRVMFQEFKPGFDASLVTEIMGPVTLDAIDILMF
jgi:hypothetical protein